MTCDCFGYQATLRQEGLISRARSDRGEPVHLESEEGQQEHEGVVREQQDPQPGKSHSYLLVSFKLYEILEKKPGGWLESSLWTHLAIFVFSHWCPIKYRSSQCSTTGVTKAVVCVILSVE